MAFTFYIMFLCLSCTFGETEGQCVVLGKMANGELLYTQVSRMPVFKKGNSDFLLYLSENVRKTWTSSENQTIVKLEFIVLSSGAIYKMGITGKESNQYSEVDKSYLKALENMPPWSPGRCGENKVAVKVLIPVRLDWQ